jgi:hypothetical protein
LGENIALTHRTQRLGTSVEK